MEGVAVSAWEAAQFKGVLPEVLEELLAARNRKPFLHGGQCRFYMGGEPFSRGACGCPYEAKMGMECILVAKCGAMHRVQSTRYLLIAVASSSIGGKD